MAWLEYTSCEYEEITAPEDQPSLGELKAFKDLESAEDFMQEHTYEDGDNPQCPWQLYNPEEKAEQKVQ